MQDNVEFITSQTKNSLLEPVRRLSKQTLLIGIGILLVFTFAIYIFIIQYAKNELENSCSVLKVTMNKANTDPLTKVGSRRFGEEILSIAFERFKRCEPSTAVLLFDIDSLKSINDIHGHSVGDVVIRSIAEAVQENIQSEDVLVRWGGDEFIGIFAGLDKEDAIPFAQKILHAVSSLMIETDIETIKPTISIGISYFTEEDHGFIDVINRADRAMYQSKAEGKDRVNIL